MQKRISCTVLLMLAFIGLLGVNNLHAQLITTSAYLWSSSSSPLNGATVQWADGTWNNYGTTGDNGPGIVSRNFPYTRTDLRLRMTWNQGSVEMLQNIQSNPIFNFYTVEAVIKLIDDMGFGIQGGRVDQGGGFWQFHGYTDINGELKIEMFPGSYKFKMGLNNSSQTITQDIATSVLFQTGQVLRDMVYTGSVKASIGGSWTDLWPSLGSSAQLLPGTYNFVYTPAPTGGSPENVTVIAGMIKTIPWGGYSVGVIPEPSSVLLLASGFLGLGAIGYFRRKRA